VFFVRDGMKFPDMVHALKPNPKNHIQEGWRIADFFSHHPEAMHMVRGAGLWAQAIWHMPAYVHAAMNNVAPSTVRCIVSACCHVQCCCAV
jgi:catalase